MAFKHLMVLLLFAAICVAHQQCRGGRGRSSGQRRSNGRSSGYHGRSNYGRSSGYHSAQSHYDLRPQQKQDCHRGPSLPPRPQHDFVETQKQSYYNDEWNHIPHSNEWDNDQQRKPAYNQKFDTHKRPSSNNERPKRPLNEVEHFSRNGPSANKYQGSPEKLRKSSWDNDSKNNRFIQNDNTSPGRRGPFQDSGQYERSDRETNRDWNSKREQMGEEHEQKYEEFQWATQKPVPNSLNNPHKQQNPPNQPNSPNQNYDYEYVYENVDYTSY